MDESVKEAFQKVKQDMNSLKDKISDICDILGEINSHNILLNKKIEKIHEINELNNKTDNGQNKTDVQDDTTDNDPLEPVKGQNKGVSIGNQGVKTDRQTDRQTNRQTQNTPEIEQNSMQDALEILNSLDKIKKGIRLKFKRLTDQEITVFSTMYQLEEELGHSNYKSISDRLNLSESSIRDYVGRIIKKGIPVDKKKINNKQIQLKISPDLKQVASLSTILELRGL